MDKQTLKDKLCAAIDTRRDELIGIGETIMSAPELGYKEFKTAALVAKKFEEMGLTLRSEIAITGVIADLPGKSHDLRVALLGELDAVLCPGHPQAEPLTGAAHSCGHNAQITSLLGAAMGLIDCGAMQYLAGDISLMAVPAEEPVEIEYRQSLRKKGKISFLGGKQEFIKLGEFDNIDAALMMHLSTTAGEVRVGGVNNGFIAKFIRYRGKEAHAGGAPHLGVNALNAAMLGLMSIHANRETFQDKDHIRVHPIISHGGDLVNVVPADVRAETYVRGANIEAIVDASHKVNRALQAGADAVGAEVIIEEIPGYLIMKQNESMLTSFKANAISLVGEEHIRRGDHGSGSTDMSDVMHLIPAIHPYIGAAVGVGHSENYQIGDPDLAYLTSSKLLAMTIIDLLWDDAALLKEIKAGYVPTYSKDSYLKFWADFCAE